MANSLSFLVLGLFAVSSIRADSKSNADAKDSHLASPGHDSTNKTVVMDNQMLRANDGADKVAEEERFVQALRADTLTAIEKVFKGGEALQALQHPRRWWRNIRQEGLIQRNAGHEKLFKGGISVVQLIGRRSPEEIDHYRQFLQRKKDTLDNLINSSGKKHQSTKWLHDQLAGLLVKWNFSNNKLLFFRVNVNTVQAKGRAKQAEAYKEFLTSLKEKVKNLM
ncbi:hypothetical protein PsorP6_017889 [Peronosclerospora sorghi]|uniref:Uncharacterized protein n=1 Tax=Peronosclerospora sorghi TaxID=230839 RepID=A0ACC0WGF8_9STRA|nr:hypothetical protein PsorP6_017889 [Peronosclerospora sorghi]